MRSSEVLFSKIRYFGCPQLTILDSVLMIYLPRNVLWALSFGLHIEIIVFSDFIKKVIDLNYYKYS